MLEENSRIFFLKKQLFFLIKWKKEGREGGQERGDEESRLIVRVFLNIPKIK